MIRLILITNSPALAAHGAACGVGRVMVDLEILGKHERQGHLDTLISAHAMSDVRPVREAVAAARAGAGAAEVMVRLNPLHAGSGGEIDGAIASGAELLMLPMWRTASEVRAFCSLVRSRARVVPLVETPEAMRCVGEAARVEGVSELYIGLNDLHLGLGMTFMFEPLASGLVDGMARDIREAGKPFGFGGIARVGQGTLPAERILGEHVRLGSSAVILSRAFHGQAKGLDGLPAGLDLASEIAALRAAETRLRQRDAAAVEADRLAVGAGVAEIVFAIRARPAKDPQRAGGRP